jgi:hypothetical protein
MVLLIDAGNVSGRIEPIQAVSLTCNAMTRALVASCHANSSTRRTDDPLGLHLGSSHCDWARNVFKPLAQDRPGKIQKSLRSH